MEKTGDENRRTVVEPFKTEHAVFEESQLRDSIFLLRDNFLLRRAYSCDKPFAWSAYFPCAKIDEDQWEAPQMRALNLIGFQVLIQL